MSLQFDGALIRLIFMSDTCSFCAHELICAALEPVRLSIRILSSENFAVAQGSYSNPGYWYWTLAEVSIARLDAQVQPTESHKLLRCQRNPGGDGLSVERALNDRSCEV